MTSSSPKTFIDLCLAGEVDLAEIDDFIDRWHDEPGNQGSLSEFLGMTADEYQLWVERPDALRFILAARKHGESLRVLLERTSGVRAAARASNEAREIVRWLQETGRI